MENNLNKYLTSLGVSETIIKAKWSKEDKALYEYICNCERNEFVTMLGLLANRLNNEVCTDKYFKEIKARFPDNIITIDQIVGAMLIVHELRQYSGHGFLPSKPPYEKTLTKVHKRIGKHFKTKVPEVSSVTSREQSITMLMVGEAVKNLNTEELEIALQGADLPPSLVKEKRKQILLQTMAASGFEGLVILLGKNVIKRAVIGILEKSLVKKMGQEAIGQILKQVAKKLPAKAFEKAFFWVGVALLVKDVWDIAGEATRVTTPLVTAIAISRTLDTAST
jgi:uncharacterized protein YaaW (UPF0174 family)